MQYPINYVYDNLLIEGHKEHFILSSVLLNFTQQMTRQALLKSQGKKKTLIKKFNRIIGFNRIAIYFKRNSINNEKKLLLTTLHQMRFLNNSLR